MKRLLLAALPAAAFIASLLVGSYPVNPLSPGPLGYTIIVEVRLPRTLMAVSAGIALGVSGLILQSVYRNPLVDTYILGVNSGVALGAAIGYAYLPLLGVPPMALAFGLAAMALTLLIAGAAGRTSPVTLVLAGILVSSLLSAALSVVELLLNPRGLAALVVWLMGSLSGATWEQAAISLPAVSVLAAAAYAASYRLDVAAMGGEEEALGVDLARTRAAAAALASLMAALVVSFTGIIGWVGLIVPHIARMSVGPRHSSAIPAAASYGAALMLVADSVARLFPVDMPVGVLTTLAGVPFFAYLLAKTGGGWR